jgi:hypothetical protein
MSFLVADSTDGGLTYQATYVVQSSDEEGTLVCAVTNFEDLSGNPGFASPAGGSSCEVIIDRTPPSANYCVSTSNQNPAFAKAGDLIKVNITTSEAVQIPGVTCNSGGNDMVFTVISGSNGERKFVATYTMTDTDVSGTVTCSLDFVDNTGNQGVYQQDPTSSCSTTVDVVVPAAFFCASCNNPFNQNSASQGDVLTIVINATEAITVPVVTCGSIKFDVVRVNPNQYVANHTVTALDPQGRLNCTVSNFTDVTSGNPGTASEIQSDTCFVIIGERG